MTRMDRLYILTTTLLLAHQIDSAYWSEWNLFRIPGGIQVFVLLNIVITLPVLVGLARVAQGAPGAVGFAVALALLGITTFFIHVGFALRGHPEFGVPMSWSILCAVLLSSVGLAWRAIGEYRERHSVDS